MSRETMEWLNHMILLNKRAWHTDDRYGGNNIYDGFVPVEEVERRLFSWEPCEGTVSTTILLPSGVATITDHARKTICRPPGALSDDDEGAILYFASQGYRIHRYDEWLLRNVATILGDDLGICAAGLLREGAQAFVNVSIPDTITTPEGVEFRPYLLAVTSLDGSLATSYGRKVTNTVCDNTMAAALREQGQTIKYRHTSNSLTRLASAQEALNIVHETGKEFAAMVDELCATTVTTAQWDAFVEDLFPTKDPKTGEPKVKNALTIAERKQEEIQSLYANDPRCAPWKGNAYGVLQTVNTHSHWNRTVKSISREERNMMRNVAGEFEAEDRATIDALSAILAAS
jgi:phage/plasmid-like protein (TIGR03299 family)